MTFYNPLINEFRSMKWIAHACHARKAHVTAKDEKKSVRSSAKMLITTGELIAPLLRH